MVGAVVVTWEVTEVYSRSTGDDLPHPLKNTSNYSEIMRSSSSFKFLNIANLHLFAFYDFDPIHLAIIEEAPTYRQYH